MVNFRNQLILSILQGKHQDYLIKSTKSEIEKLTRIVAKLSDEPTNRESNENKIYVGNMSPSTTTITMKTYFEKYGKVINAFIVRKHETSLFGFVQFSDPNTFHTVLNLRPHVINGRNVIVDKAHNKKRHRGGKENQQPLTETKVFKALSGNSKTSRFSPY